MRERKREREREKTGCSNQNEAMRNLQNVIDLLQLRKEQAEQLCLSLFGEVNMEEQVGLKYRYDQCSGQEIIVIPREALQTNNASTTIEKESSKSFDEEACRGKEFFCNGVCKFRGGGRGRERGR